MEPLFSPLFTFLVFLFISYMIYRFGESLAPKTVKSDAKLSPYACGEDLPGGKIPPSFTLFHVAFIFTVFHVAILLLVLVPSSEPAIYALIFLGGLLVTALALLTSGGEETD